MHIVCVKTFVRNYQTGIDGIFVMESIATEHSRIKIGMGILVNVPNNLCRINGLKKGAAILCSTD